MIISNSQILNLLKTYSKQDSQDNPIKKVGKKSTKVKATDETIMSEQAKVFQKARNVVEETPDIREEKVQELKQRVKVGAYTVSGDEIAEKMLARSIVDQLV